jgi:exodeoxyribonuclease VII small subunit
MSEALDPSLNYDDAVRELQEILSALQSGELGIDELTSKLQRAGLLLDFCQGKLAKTEAEVQAVLTRLGLEGSE